MSRTRALLGFLIMLGGAVICGLWPKPLPPIPSQPEIHQTRGLAIQETPDERALRLAMEKIAHEPPLTPLAILQAGVTFNGEIPLWGLLSALVVGVAAFAALKMQMTAHEKSDDERFGSTNEMLTEIRGDVKRLLSHAREDE